MIPLRILHAVPSLDSLELQAALPLLTALTAAGHQLALLMPLAPDAPPAPMVPSAGLPVLTYTSGWWRWWRHERAATVRKVATWTPDLVHVHGLANLPATLDIARRLGLSVIVTLHHAEEPYAARRLRDPLVAWVLVPTEHHRAHCLSRIGLTRDRVAIVPMGVALQPAPLLSALASDWIIGCVDSGERPALRRWLMAVAEIQHAGLPLAARLFTHDRQRARELADDLACQVTVTDAGHATDFIATCDALAIPGTHECHPLLPLTAMAAGKPLIAVAAGGLPELVRDGQTAVLIAADDSDALADALRHLHDRGRRQQMGDAARVFAYERYRASVVVEALAAVYRSALGDTGAGDKAEITTTWRRLTEKNSASYASAALPES
jgi:glycosyltransferase involved in cell wall biosynthesis